MATSEFDDASFKKYVQAQIAERDAVIADRDAEIERLKREIAELRKKKGIPSARDGLTYNEHTGLWADQAGLLYCSTCLDQDKRNPMKTELPRGWRCSAVPKHYFSNPDDRPPVLNMRGPRGGGGSGGWMA